MPTGPQTSGTTPSGAERPPVIHEGLPTQLPDIDPEETAEWVGSLDQMVDERGRARARYVMLRLLERAREKQVGVPALRSTDFINTIPPEREPWFPGNEAIERRIRAFIRWNAAVMVSRANRPGLGVGGHIATYQSAASLYEVGFNHFFRGKGHPGGGDQIYFQGHAAPGIYARSYLEGRLTEEQLDRFRQERSHGLGNGLSSYPHPRLMPHYWEFPTVSMGLAAINSIYQARFNRYLQHRGIKDTSGQRVWCFLGDGEMGEPESLGAIGIAAREELDNLTFVINCNLQQLDGPVRGNGKIIQELESFFRGAGWNVVKVVWGRQWDDLLARDSDGALVNQMNRTPDGEFQTLSVESGAYNREHFFGADPRLAKMVEHLSDEQIERLPRGGHDYRKVYAAFDAAVEHTGQPTVILAHTIKGWLLESFQGRNATHQMKKLTKDDLKQFRDRLAIPISDEQIDGDDLAPFYHPGNDSEEIQYMKGRRDALGGSMPVRKVDPTPLKLPGDDVYAPLKQGSGKQEIATTMAFVRLLRDLMKDPEIGQRIVPIAPDEYRTFGMDSMFPSAKIYSPHGQTYESVDRKLLLAYKESVTGQLLHEGISEAGAMASAIAAGSAYSTQGEPMIPVYMFYSMFGFQRTADSIWSMADQLARGFLVGATAGRTTLTGEGLQHADGHSPLIAQTNPAIVHYDPAYGYEISHIVKDGLARMYGTSDEFPHGEDIIYYLTVYNEPIKQPVEPDDVDVEGILMGAHLLEQGRSWIDQRAHHGVRGRGAVGAQGAGDARRALRRRRRRLVRHVVERARPRRGGVRAVEPQPSRRLHAGAMDHHEAHGPRVRHRGGQRLHAGGARPDRALGARPVAVARHRRIRLRRHPGRRPPHVPGRRRVDRRHRAPDAGAAVEGRSDRRPRGLHVVADRRPHGRRRSGPGRHRRLTRGVPSLVRRGDRDRAHIRP